MTPGRCSSPRCIAAILVHRPHVFSAGGKTPPFSTRAFPADWDHMLLPLPGIGDLAFFPKTLEAAATFGCCLWRNAPSPKGSRPVRLQRILCWAAHNPHFRRRSSHAPVGNLDPGAGRQLAPPPERPNIAASIRYTEWTMGTPRPALTPNRGRGYAGACTCTLSPQQPSPKQTGL